MAINKSAFAFLAFILFFFQLLNFTKDFCCLEYFLLHLCSTSNHHPLSPVRWLTKNKQKNTNIQTCYSIPFLLLKLLIFCILRRCVRFNIRYLIPRTKKIIYTCSNGLTFITQGCFTCEDRKYVFNITGFKLTCHP